jgi:hypothetical protein
MTLAGGLPLWTYTHDHVSGDLAEAERHPMCRCRVSTASYALVGAMASFSLGQSRAARGGMLFNGARHPKISSLNSAYRRYNVTSFSVIALSAGLCDSDSEGNLVIRPRPCHWHVISSWQTTPGPPAQFRSCEADGDDFTPYLNPDSPLLMIFHPLFSISHGVGQHGPPSQ